MSEEQTELEVAYEAADNHSTPSTGRSGSGGSGLYDRPIRIISDASTLQVPPCAVCDGDKARPAFQVQGIASVIVVCTGCGLGYYHPMLGLREISSFYPKEYYGEPGAKFRPVIERLVRIVGRRHIAFLSRSLKPGARVLDVGCGRGVLLGPLADLGFEVHGLEISEEAVEGVDPRAEIRIATRLSDAGHQSSYFDEIIIWHTLEHTTDPRGILQECHRILRPGGRLIVAVPNFSSAQARWSGGDWFHLDTPRHLYHFPVPALRRLIERCGFVCSTEHHFSLRQNPFGWIQSALNRFSSQPRNALYSLLYSRKRHELRRAGRSTYWIWGLFLLAGPVALGLAVLAALFRSGATVHVVAHRKDESTAHWTA